MSRKELKKGAKTKLNGHFSFFFLLFLPYIVLYFIGSSQSNSQGLKTLQNQQTGLNWGSILLLLASLILVGAQFVSLDSIRNKVEYTQGFSKGFTIFSNSKYFWGAVGIGLLEFIWVFLWTLLLFVPGIIKGLAYSQAFYIYRDSVDAGQPLRFRDAVTQSRQMMDGHKWEFFVLQLSLIGWRILVWITNGLAGIWVFPYTNLTYANYYDHLKEEQAGNIVEPATEN